MLINLKNQQNNTGQHTNFGMAIKVNSKVYKNLNEQELNLLKDTLPQLKEKAKDVNIEIIHTLTTKSKEPAVQLIITPLKGTVSYVKRIFNVINIFPSIPTIPKTKSSKIPLNEQDFAKTISILVDETIKDFYDDPFNVNVRKKEIAKEIKNLLNK